MSEKKKSGGALLGAAFLMATSAIAIRGISLTRIPDTDSNLYRTVSGKFWICYPGFRNPCSHCTAEYLACALCDRTSWSGCFQ